MLEQFAEWFAYSALGMGRGSQLGEAAVFFIYDSVKVTLLLAITSLLSA